MELICKDCGRGFELTIGEIDFYKQMGFNIPRRCKSCRDRNKKYGGSVHDLMRSEVTPRCDTKKWSVSVSGTEIRYIADEYIYEEDYLSIENAPEQWE